MKLQYHSARIRNASAGVKILLPERTVVLHQSTQHLRSGLLNSTQIMDDATRTSHKKMQKCRAYAYVHHYCIRSNLLASNLNFQTFSQLKNQKSETLSVYQYHRIGFKRYAIEPLCCFRHWVFVCAVALKTQRKPL